MNDPFTIVFNDNYIVVLNKIAKVVIQPTPKKEKHTLTSLLQETIKGKVFPCHRLDRETTGAIVYAKSRAVQEKIMEQFKGGEVKKKYIAFIRGSLRKKSGFLDEYIIDKDGARFGEKAKRAKTYYRILNGLKGFSVVELQPVTGRTNQLRIQLANLGHPILGERRYAFGRDFKINFKRLALHASFISFIHPISKQRVGIGIDLPQDMSFFIAGR